MSVFQIIGLIGFVAYIGSFAALQTKRLDGNGAAYCLLNILAAALVLVSLAEDFNLASILIQVSWIGIGVVGIFWKVREAFYEVGRIGQSASRQSLVS